jgi:hypothetical protein
MMANHRIMMLRGIVRSVLADAAPSVVAERPLSGVGVTAEVRCRKCGSVRHHGQICRPCRRAKGLKVGTFNPTESTTPTQRAERATL